MRKISGARRGHIKPGSGLGWYFGNGAVGLGWEAFEQIYIGMEKGEKGVVVYA